ncbi:L-rhamnose operon transcriptional activator RhaR [Agrobacterium sp. DSM 25558]|uniref:L-rhamnose operon transcriptional activator RhaR n=1 Tax=Agrobacterium rosae TaxID=1972867 RepID=A0A1R3U630_9HYPH|nr:L-rhamnose operon transcriptional activator RhaR [Agrobacterium sp. DSM 25558]SCX32185.1 L-rhamnose operon transcriptional activator RhaR [Agrobacterium rosae]
MSAAPDDKGLPIPGKTSDKFGCTLTQLSINQSLSSSNIDIFRKATQSTALDQVKTFGSNQGFVVGVSLRTGHQRRIFHENHATNHDFSENAIYIRDLSDNYKADLSTPFDFMLFQISPSSLAKIAEDADVGGVTLLTTETACKDIVLANLARALLPALQRPEEANALFVDQMTTAIGTYLVQRYGGKTVPAVSKARTLSRAHLEMAKSILLEHVEGQVSIADVAEACNLSRGYFIRAFREATGLTPYQWLLNQRIDRARHMISATSISLAEIAVACGFADQSHFTRVFSAFMGTTPGTWRRNI